MIKCNTNHTLVGMEATAVMTASRKRIRSSIAGSFMDVLLAVDCELWL